VFIIVGVMWIFTGEPPVPRIQRLVMKRTILVSEKGMAKLVYARPAA